MRLELSSEGRYALRDLLYLARTGERVPAQRISAEAHVPRRLLARILATLAGAGLVRSEQGSSGGSRLARPVDQITLREAVEAVGGPFGVTRCIVVVLGGQDVRGYVQDDVRGLIGVVSQDTHAFNEEMDEILVLDAGKIVERGKHCELESRRGMYHRMLEAQRELLLAL